MNICTPRDWQQIALREAAELLGTAEGAAKLAEARRYGACADEIVRLQAMCAESDGRIELLAGEVQRLNNSLELRRSMCADADFQAAEVDRLQHELADIREAITEQCVMTECVSPDGPVRDVLQALQVWHARLGAEMERQARDIGVALHPELIGVALDALATPADDVGELP